MKRALHAALACAAIAACIEPRSAFEPADRIPLDGLVVRLTYNPGDDRTPSWTPDGKAVLYVAEDPPARGRLVALPADGAQPGGPVFSGVPALSWLAAPRQSPTDGRVAYVEVVNAQAPCGGRIGVEPACTPAPWRAFSPVLIELRLRVRDRAATGFIEQDPSVVLHFESQEFNGERDGFPTEVLRFEPWQTELHTEGTWGLRADWSPDGRRVVFSDGARLLVWDVDDAAAPIAAIPGTADGISPAWQPDGEWIAYTRLVRGAQTTGFCTGVIPGWGPVCSIDQHIANVADRLIVLTRPDGSQEQVLGPGDEPAWGPDGTLYFRRDAQVWRFGEPPQPVPGTHGGREPAVSPDGRQLAFSHRNEGGSYDIWVMRLAD